MRSRKRLVTVGTLFAVCVLTSFFIKTCHYNMEAAQTAKMIGDARPLWYGDFRDALPLKRPNFIPYTIESAMMYAYSKDIAEGKGVPAKDKRLAYLPEVAPYAQMNMALEWVLGWSYRIKCFIFPPAKPTPQQLRYQDNPDFAAWCAFNVRLWTALIPGLIFLWLAVLRTPLPLAFAGGMLHAVSAASIARATGQDIVRGDFCIPLIILCMYLVHSFYVRPSRWKLAVLFFSTLLAFASWDLCQLLFGAWAAYEILRYLITGISTEKRRRAWLVIYLAIAVNALFIPFNVTYGLIMSPFFCILLPLLLILLWWNTVKRSVIPSLRSRLILFFVIWGCLYGFHASFIDNPVYRANYSHFTEAMKAKWKYNNVKPLDPSKLNYDARMMWTPSMHSATWNLSIGFFPSMGSLPLLPAKSGPTAFKYIWNYAPVTISFLLFLLVLGGLFTPVRTSLLRDLPRSLLPFLFTFGFIIGFVFIVRYHEFVIIFLALSLPMAVQGCLRGLRHYSSKNRIAKILRILLCILLVLILFIEFYASAAGRKRSYSKDVYLRHTVQLIEWFRRNNMEDKTVIANFTIGPMLMAYCGTNIVLQPQFGMEPIRRPVEEYLNLLYHKDERALSEFCTRYGASYFIYDHGSVGPLHPFSTRYIANAANLTRESPAYRMYYEPNRLTDFYKLKPPQDLSELSVKYSVFRVVSFDERMDAMKLYTMAEKAYRAGKFMQAGKLLKASIWLDPCSDEARTLFFKIFNRLPQITLTKVI